MKKNIKEGDTTAEEANNMYEVFRDYLKIMNDINDYIQSHASELSDDEIKQLRNEHRKMSFAADDILLVSAKYTLAELQGYAEMAKDTTTKITAITDTINNMKKFIDITCALIVLALKIYKIDIEGILSSLKELTKLIEASTES